MKTFHRTYASINLDAVEENFSLMKRNLKEGTQMIAVVKTDAYGHGALAIAGQVENYTYVWGFATATVEEAVALRNSGITKPILILGYSFKEDYQTLVDLEIRPAVFKRSTAKELSEAALKLGRKIKIHLALDTGMTRIGFSDRKETVAIIKEISELPGVEVEGLFTHFARADEEDKSHARIQLIRYLNFVERLKQAGIMIPIKHCSNSAGIMELPEAHLDAVRPGISIYGIYPSDEMNRKQMKLKPVMEWKTHIVYIKDVESGVAISYGGTYVTEHPMRVATIPVGYGDGYPRSLSNRGYVLIHGKKAPILGRVCMDQFMVDVTDIPAREMDEVTLMGVDGNETLSVDTLGKLSGRFPYEFVCDVGKRVPRIYIKDQKIISSSSPIFY